MILASLETQSFTFHSLGYSEIQAVEAMRVGWEKHKVIHEKLTNATPIYEWDDVKDDVSIIEIQPGIALRDGAKI